MAEPLPSPLHSLSLYVTTDEKQVKVHDGPKVNIIGKFYDRQFLKDTYHNPVERNRGNLVYGSTVFSMFAVMWVAYGMSNHREVRGLWQM